MDLSIFGYDFMMRALIGALIIGVAAPSVGVFLVQKRMALIGDGIGHVALTGVAVGFLMGEGTAWRNDRRKRRVFFWLAIAWASLFAARLLVQLPLYFADDVTALGTLKLVMGLPLFAPLVAVTWLAVRALYPRGESREEAAAE